MIQTAMASRRAKHNETREFFSNKLALAMIVIAGGFLLLLTGIILSAISFVLNGRFHGWDVTTLIASFVLLAFGSHFLDKSDAAKKNARLAFGQRRLVNNKQIKTGKLPEN